MTDEPDGPDEPDDPKDEPFDDDTYGEFLKEQRETFRHAVPDPILASIVKAANRHGFTIGLTLFVHGTVVTGQLVAISRFMAETRDFLVGTSKRESALARSFSEASVTHAVRSVVDEDPPLPMFIHLVDAQLWAGGSLTAVGLRWRGRLVSVDAWTVGVLQVPG